MWVSDYKSWPRIEQLLKCLLCRISDPFTEIPADMLLFHMCIPFAIEHFRPRATIKSILISWFSLAGWALGLSDFLLPGPGGGGRGSVIHNNVQERRGYFTETMGYLQVYPQRVPAASHNHNNVCTSSDSSDTESDPDDLNYISEVEDEPSQYVPLCNYLVPVFPYVLELFFNLMGLSSGSWSL